MRRPSRGRSATAPCSPLLAVSCLSLDIHSSRASKVEVKDIGYRFLWGIPHVDEISRPWAGNPFVRRDEPIAVIAVQPQPRRVEQDATWTPPGFIARQG